MKQSKIIVTIISLIILIIGIISIFILVEQSQRPALILIFGAIMILLQQVVFMFIKNKTE